MQVPQDYIDKFAFIDVVHRRKYAAMANWLDDAVSSRARKRARCAARACVRACAHHHPSPPLTPGTPA